MNNVELTESTMPPETVTLCTPSVKQHAVGRGVGAWLGARVGGSTGATLGAI